MRQLAIALLLVAACSEPRDVTTDTRTPITVEYVRNATVKIHTQPRDDAPVVTTYQHGEAVSVLSRREPWDEVRTVAGSGWAHSDELSDAVDNSKPHFLRSPEPVSQPGAHGELVLEADVGTDGTVVNVRTLRNTTGSPSLEERNITELRKALFTPVVHHGQREAFVYEHRVQY